ncbi:MAG: hypothetical protein DRP82_06655 [Planctomycetota bacterium]|nr:MAG: hypothetical protein DRP82_06655 [Planctomycetota bacterium]
MARVALVLLLNCLVLPGAGNVVLGRRSGWVQGLMAAPCMALFGTAAINNALPQKARLLLPSASFWLWGVMAVWAAVAVWSLADMVVALMKEARRCRVSSSQEPTQE